MYENEDVPDLRHENCEYVTCDVTSEGDVQKAINVTLEKFGELHAVVNSAGVIAGCRVYDKKRDKIHPLDVYNHVMSINAMGTFNVSRLATAAMFKHTKEDEHGMRGVIINVSSIAGVEAQVGNVAYGATKGAVNGMTLALARDNADIGIRCVTIAPGVISSPMVDTLPEKVKNGIIKNIPSPSRFGKPEEFAQLVEHVILNRYINGEIIRLDAAYRMQPTA